MAGKTVNGFFIFSAVILLFLAGCSVRDIEIIPAEEDTNDQRTEASQDSAENNAAEEVAVSSDTHGVEIPSLEIISPKDSEMIKGRDVKIVFKVAGFNLELPNSPVKEGSGYIHIWFDSIERKSADSEVVFRDAGSGRHSVIAELRKSDGTPFAPGVREMITINVNNPEAEDLQKPMPVKAEADDFGFYPSQIKVKRSKVIALNISVRKENVYFNGLEFEGRNIGTGRIYPGDSKVVQFVSNEDFKITSYWPSTRDKKAELQIVVE